jgi:transposase
MVNVDEFARVRRAHRDGMTIREMARTFHHSRRKIREILAAAEPKPYVRLNPPATVVDPFKPVIEAILAADAAAPRKQRHTAKKIFRRLRDEHGYSGSYERVRLYVRKRAKSERETFIPLNHDPGQRVELDFGHVYVDFPEGRQQVAVLLATWSHSNCPYAIALPTERLEAILHGMVEAFAFFGCVPREAWWDNATTLVPHLFEGRQRLLNARYQALASHYLFEPMFCLVRRPQEKPRVEGRVQFLQREWCTPVPRFKDLGEFNAHLRVCCLGDRERTQAGQTETIGQRFAFDRDKALSLPKRAFDPCIARPGKVDKYQTVQFDANRYSVPRAYAFTAVTVKGYVARVEVVAEGRVVAAHSRSYGRGEQILDPIHFLASLGRRPAALDHANVYRQWVLPALFTELRQSLENRQGKAAGARQFIRVLQCLNEHSIPRVEREIAAARVGAPASGGENFDVEAIVRRLRNCAERRGEERRSPDVPDDPNALGAVPNPSECQPYVTTALATVHVPLVSLCSFDQLLNRDEVPHVRETDRENARKDVREAEVRSASDAGEGQLEASPAADHAR